MTSSYTQIGNCLIDRTATICSGAIIGKPFRKLLGGFEEETEITTIGPHAYIGHFAIIGNGTTIGANTIVDDRCTMESRVSVGKTNLLIYSAQLCNDVTVGDCCVIGGLVGERTKIGNRCRIFGSIAHSQHDPLKGWDDESSTEPSLTIEDEVFIGFGAILSGEIVLSRRSYVTSGAIVTKNVPSFHIATGVNDIIHHSKWTGPLRESEFFKNGHD